MGFAGQGADSPIMSDAFIAFRLMVNSLEDLLMAMDPGTGKLRVSVDAGTFITSGNVITLSGSLITNVQQIGGNAANSFIFDEMDVVWNTGIRPQIV